MFNISDDELLNMDLEQAQAQVQDSFPTEDDEEDGRDPADEQQQESDDSAGSQTASDDSEDGESTDESDVKDAGVNSEEGSKDDSTAEEKSEETTDSAKEKQTSDSKDAVNFEAEYKKLLAPFKANGRDMQVQNVDEAVQLMKMGANYNKKMAGLKPSLRILKMLENNKLLDESKLAYLIDLSNKEPGAIGKLIKDSGVDPLDLSDDKADAYSPKPHQVDDAELAMDEVIRDLQTSESFTTTSEHIKKMDQASKRTLSEQPGIMATLDEHVSLGLFDKVMGEVERRRVFGQLNGLSDLQAYNQVGNEMAQAGAFGSVQNQQQSATEQSTQSDTSEEDNKVKSRKRAAAPAKGKATSRKRRKDFNPLSLSDEEIENMTLSQFE